MDERGQRVRVQRPTCRYIVFTLHTCTVQTVTYSSCLHFYYLVFISYIKVSFVSSRYHTFIQSGVTNLPVISHWRRRRRLSVFSDYLPVSQRRRHSTTSPVAFSYRQWHKSGSNGRNLEISNENELYFCNRTWQIAEVISDMSKICT